MLRLILNDVGSACEAMSVYGEDFVGGGLEMGKCREQARSFRCR